MLAAAAAQADTINFAALNNALEGNTLNVGGVSDNLIVSGAADGNNYLYSVTYTGADYDGDTFNDTLSFEVLVQGWTGSTASTTYVGSEADVSAQNGTASIGATDSAVDVSGGTRFSVVNGVMTAGQTLEFSLQNLLVTGTTSGDSYGASLNAFTGTTLQETGRGFGHIAVIGEGDSGDLWSTRFNATVSSKLDGLLNETDTLLITSAQLHIDSNTGEEIASSNPQRWGVMDVDFGVDVTVIPEPAALTLVGLTGLGFMWIKRRFS
jgi:hypothetical protein